MSVSFQGTMIVDSVKYTAQDIRDMIKKLDQIRAHFEKEEKNIKDAQDYPPQSYQRAYFNGVAETKKAILEITDGKKDAETPA